MRLNLDYDGLKIPAESCFAGPTDVKAVVAMGKIGESSQVPPEIIDQVEFATFTGKRWKSYMARGRTTQSEHELSSACSENPKEEFTSLLVLKTKAKGLPPVLGFCLFRRTWCNHLTLDFLANNPRLILDNLNVKGVGAGLLAHLSQIALELDCPAIWCETTESSSGFYRNLFKLKTVDDLCRIKRSRFKNYLASSTGYCRQKGLL